jgi:hypothetical protein
MWWRALFQDRSRLKPMLEAPFIPARYHKYGPLPKSSNIHHGYEEKIREAIPLPHLWDAGPHVGRGLPFL